MSNSEYFSKNLYVNKKAAKEKKMTTIGNFFAFGILLLISMVFFKSKYFITKASKCYIALLAASFLSALVNTARVQALEYFSLPNWVIYTATSIDLTLIIATVSLLALYLIYKVTEHIFTEKQMLVYKVALSSIFSAALLVIILNIPFGYIFTAENGAYIKGAAFFLPYLFILPHIAVVFICCVKYRKNLSKNVRTALIESVPAVLFCFIIKLLYDNVLIALLSVTFIELIFFLNFLNQRIGVNTLTKLNDSRRFITEITKRIHAESPFKAYVMEIENIGLIGQNYGHKAGNEVLYLFGFSLEKLFSEAIAFHLGGSTFALVLPYNEELADEQNEKLIGLLETNIRYMNSEIDLDYVIAEHVWQDEPNADVFYEKLEYAIEIGRTTKQRYVKYTPELEAARLRKKYLIDRMQEVSAEAGFEPWFQPIYNSQKKAFCSMEVLLRLKEKSGSYISPAEFIPLAEKTGQIVPITWFVIKETCKILSKNPILDGIRASINLPMFHLVDESFEGQLNEIVDGYGISHDRISFEFTERVILDELDVAEKNMRRLKNSGYSFYLDDFGTGYSNFNCVLRLPFETIKLDMSLTSTAQKLRDNYGLVNVLTDLFHDMGLNVVAEGAETAEQVDLLHSYGVDNIQGYYFAKPMPLEKLKAFLTDRKQKKDFKNK